MCPKYNFLLKNIMRICIVLYVKSALVWTEQESVDVQRPNVLNLGVQPGSKFTVAQYQMGGPAKCQSSESQHSCLVHPRVQLLDFTSLKLSAVAASTLKTVLFIK